MSDSLIVLSVSEGVARITLNRGSKRNALTREMLADLRRHLQSLQNRPEIRLLVLAANGSAFCAGMDLVQMHETATRADARQVWRADAELYRDVVAALFSLAIPTLAIVQGPAIAGGLGLVLACDIVVASDSATFGLPEPRRGITAGIVTPLLVYRVGGTGAALLLLSSAAVDAGRARELGICQDVVSGAQIADAAHAMQLSILHGAPGALAATKEQLRSCAGVHLLRQLDQAVAVSAEARATDEAREGLQAFLEKRSPHWQPGS